STARPGRCRRSPRRGRRRRFRSRCSAIRASRGRPSRSRSRRRRPAGCRECPGRTTTRKETIVIDQPYDLAALAEKAEAAMRDFDTETERVAELQRQWADGSGDETVRAKDRSLSMTFNARGELVGMKFHGDKFRSMAAAELAHVIVETA